MNKSLNMVKCIAALFVILIHCVSYNTRTYVGVINALIRCAVPIFALISGYYSFFSDKNVDKQEKYKKRVIKLIKLIVVTIIGYALFQIYRFNGKYEQVLKLYNIKTIYKLIVLNASPLAGHLWYIYALLYCYVFLIITSKLDIKMEKLYKYIPILLILNILMGEISFSAKLIIPGIYSRNFLFLILPFFLIGYYLHDKKIFEKIKTKEIIVMIIISIILTIIERLATAQYDTYIGTIILSVSIFMLCLKHPNGIKLGLLEWIGANLSTTIYIIHLAVLQVLGKIEKANNINFIDKWYINVFIVFFISAILSWLIYGIKKLIEIRRNGMEKISLVVPCYNEEKNVELFYNECIKVFKNFNYEIEIIFVNDGSKDNTIDELKKLIQKEDYIYVKVVGFSRNFGKEAAMYAGLEHSTGNYIAIIDADLQQRPEIIKDMIKEIEKDSTIDCVCCYQEKRIEGKVISFFKKAFYKCISKFTKMDFVNGASDFRLLKRKVVDAILSLNEKNRFSKGIFNWIGFKTKYIPYTPEDRKYGTSSFNFRKLMKYAISGIISFSVAPLYFSIYLGIIFSLLSAIYLIIVIIQKIFFTINVPGFTTLLACILLIGGNILFVLGIIGAYIARIYIETKARPIYIENEILESKNMVIHN